MARYVLLTEELEDEIAAGDREEQSYWLIVDDHPDFEGFWIVDCLYPEFMFDFEPVIGSWRALAPSKLDEFLTLAEEGGYHVAFVKDPQTVLDYYERLNEPPPFEINSEQGYYPWQVQGFNFLTNPDNRCGLARWDTGTGKGVLAGMLFRWHWMNDDFDLGFMVVKKNNRIGTARKLKKLFDLDTVPLYGERDKRYDTYEHLVEMLDAGHKQVVVTNYEKFREDEEWFKGIVGDFRVLAIWDEMPSKLRTRGTQLYDAVGRTFYTSWRKPLWHRKRPKNMRMYETSATPIERDPGDHFNCIRIMDPDVFGMTVDEFENEFVLARNYLSGRPEEWMHLEKIGLITAHVTHDVSKEDPEVAQHFPRVLEEQEIIDWDPRDREVYDILTGRAADMLDEDFGQDSVLAVITLMQMLCDAPSMLHESSENWKDYEKELEAFLEETGVGGSLPPRRGSEAATRLLRGLKRRLTDSRHTKREKLGEDLTKHLFGMGSTPLYTDGVQNKAIVFTVYAMMLDRMSAWLTEWGIKHVVFRGTERERQAAIDAFEDDPEVLVFLSTDAGSDSIDLPAANLVVNYDLPWLWARKVQRQNRAHRVISKHGLVRIITYTMADSIEDRKLELIMLRMGYHDAIFKGVVKERTFSARITTEDFLWMLTGQRRE